MFEREKRVLARHCLDEGMSKAEVARRVGIGRRTLYNWIADGLLEGRPGDQKSGYGPRQPRVSKLDPFKGIIQARLAEYPELSAARLFEEVRAAGYPGGYDQVKRHVREVRPREPAERHVRFETPPGHQGADSGPCRSAIPFHADHLFRRMPITDSEACRSPWSERVAALENLM